MTFGKRKLVEVEEPLQFCGTLTESSKEEIMNRRYDFSVINFFRVFKANTRKNDQEGEENQKTDEGNQVKSKEKDASQNVAPNGLTLNFKF